MRNWLDTSPRTLTTPPGLICAGLSCKGGSLRCRDRRCLHPVDANRRRDHRSGARACAARRTGEGAAGQRQRGGQRPEGGPGIAEEKVASRTGKLPPTPWTR